MGSFPWSAFLSLGPGQCPAGDVVKAAANQTATSCGRRWPFPGQTGTEDT